MGKKESKADQSSMLYHQVHRAGQVLAYLYSGEVAEKILLYCYVMYCILIESVNADIF